LYARNQFQKEITRGIFTIKSSPILTCFFFITMFLVTGPLIAEDNFIFSDTSFTYSVTPGTHKKSALKRYLKWFSGEEKKKALLDFLDSTGYFTVNLDTIADDTIVINPGKRSLVGSIVIQSACSFTIDSIQPVHFPIYYDAGYIQACAQKALAFLAQRGYPFARLSIMIAKQDSIKGSSNTNDIDTSDNNLILTFVIDTQKRCVFGNPLFSGELKTRRKVLAHDIVFFLSPPDRRFFPEHPYQNRQQTRPRPSIYKSTDRPKI
jgi:hypothetical protein